MDPPSPVARALGLLGLGALLACAGGVAADVLQSVPEPSTSVALWVADRGRVVGLDRDLRPAREVAVPRPTALARRRDGGAWTTSVADPRKRGSERLLRLDREGRAVDGLPPGALTGEVVDLASIDGADALLLLQLGRGEPGEGDGGALPRADPPPRRIVRISAAGAVLELLERGGLAAACGRGSLVLAGTQRGELLIVRGTGSGPAEVRGEGCLGEPIRDVAPGPGAGLWWVLSVPPAAPPAAGGLEPPPPCRLHLVGSELAPRWSSAVDVDAPRLIPVPGEERVWLAGATRPELERYGRGGTLELARRDLPLAAGEAGVAWRDGGVLLAAPGAVLHLDRYGRSAPGQGGFRFIAGLAAARR